MSDRSERPQAVAQEIRGLLLARAGSFGLLFLSLLAARLWLDIPITSLALAICLLWPALISITLLMGRRHRGSVGLTVQLGLDLLGVGLVLALSGGHENPLGFLLLIPVALATIRLPLPGTILMAILAIGIYSLLYAIYLPLPGSLEHGMDHRFNIHLTGMWVGFVAAAVLIAGIGGRLSQTLRARELALAQQQKQALEDKRLLALGAMAAGTAHELSTPLASLKILSDELARDAKTSLEQERIEDLSHEINRCQRVIERSLEATGNPRADRGESLTADQLLPRLIQYWRDLGGTPPNIRQRGPTPAPRILMDAGLLQAMASLVHNAFEWGEAPVEVQFAWSRDQAVLRVCDRGQGIQNSTRSQAGKREEPINRERPRGLGLFLAESVIRRHGGRLTLRDRANGGTIARVELPTQEATRHD
ncbi:two-component system sensor histidine kinase RegB [Natronospira proteinivora]|uniref:histidine kinase n=1 Tax=Natronospira proteinivora TaxID=1807133 RepID=A0ABT1GAK4_9GAMM|nr:ATP-binding protein [Natronospira proteinivora]MCP1728342.1 two-component system sensor histidine kinase RegB [Natronospira proteinivora]